MQIRLMTSGHQATIFVADEERILWVPIPGRNPHVLVGWELCRDKLSGPHFPEVYGISGAGVLMEFVQGSAPTTWNEAQAQEILAQLLDANIFHRDIRLANLIERPDGNWCLLDFGWACDYNDIYEAPWFLGAEGRKGKGVQDDAFAMDVVRQVLEV